LRLGLHPRPNWGILQRSLRHLAGFRDCFVAGEGIGRKERGAEGRRVKRERGAFPHFFIYNLTTDYIKLIAIR